MPVWRRGSSPMLQAAAWISTRLRTFSWPRTHTRRIPPVSYICAKVRSTTSPRQRCRRRPRRPRTRRRFPYSARCAAAFAGGVSPVFLSCQRHRPRSGSDTWLRTPTSPRATSVSSLWYPLSATIWLFDPSTVRLHQLHLLNRRDQRRRQRRRIAGRCILHRRRDDGPRIHVDPMLRIVGQMRPAVLHLRDLPVRDPPAISSPCSTSSCASGTGRTEPEPRASGSPPPTLPPTAE